jgi:hypothetical protein
VKDLIHEIIANVLVVIFAKLAILKTPHIEVFNVSFNVLWTILQHPAFSTRARFLNRID